MTDVSKLAGLAAAISKSSPAIRAYSVAQAAATVSQEADLRDLHKQVDELRGRMGPGITAAPIPGSLIVDVDYSTGDASQWAGHSISGYSGTTAGTYYTIETRNGVYCCKHTELANYNRSEFGNWYPDFFLGVDRYYATEFELPTDFDWRSTGPAGLEITQFDQNNGDAAAPYLLTLGGSDYTAENAAYADALHVTIQTGQIINPPNAGCEFSNGPGGNIPHLWAIPGGQVPLGQRIQVILHTFRTGETVSPFTGYVETWWKLHGEPQSAWRYSTGGTGNTGRVTGIPTMQHYPSQPVVYADPYPGTIVCKWGTYRNPNNAYPVSLWHYRALLGTTFAVVAAKLT